MMSFIPLARYCFSQQHTFFFFELDSHLLNVLYSLDFTLKVERQANIGLLHTGSTRRASQVEYTPDFAPDSFINSIIFPLKQKDQDFQRRSCELLT